MNYTLCRHWVSKLPMNGQAFHLLCGIVAAYSSLCSEGFGRIMISMESVSIERFAAVQRPELQRPRVTSFHGTDLYALNDWWATDPFVWRPDWRGGAFVLPHGWMVDVDTVHDELCDGGSAGAPRL